MKKIYNSLIMAFSMYSKLPMPQVEWREENKAYAFAFFPLVATVEMLCILGVYWVFGQWKEPLVRILIGIFLTVFQILYTGGIHMDGFMDTCDALGSHAPKEKKLEIMKDSHVGSVAVLAAVFYVLIYYLGMSQVQMKHLLIFGFVLIAERVLSVFSLLHFPIARKNGMAADFVYSAKVRNSKIILGVIFLLSIMAMAVFHWKMAVFIVIYFLGMTFWYVKKMQKEIGGLTGDTSGFFLQVTEIGALWLILLLY